MIYRLAILARISFVGLVQRPQHCRKIRHRLPGVEVVIAQDTAVAGKGVLVQAAACWYSRSAARSRARFWAVRKGVGVVFALESPAAAQSVLVEVAGLLVVA